MDYRARGVAACGSVTNIARRMFLSSLYNNAFYLIVNSASKSILGFIFWDLMARSSSAVVVGIGSALYSAAGLIASLANLGLDNALIRFSSEAGDRARQLVNSVLFGNGVVAFLTAVIYVAGSKVWSPDLAFLNKNYLVALGFVAVTVSMSLSQLFDYSFIAQRLSRYTLWKNLFVRLVKIPLAALIALQLGGYGIFLGNGVAVILALIGATLFLIPRAYSSCDSNWRIDFGLLRNVLPFSFSNYLANLLTTAIGFIFPLMVLNLRGAEDSAYFYMAWMIASVINVVPQGVANSLFAEGSHCPQKLNHQIKRALGFSFGLLVPSVGILYLLASFLLRFFGSGYAAHGSEVLRWLLLGTFPYAINSFYITVNQVKKKLSYIILQSLVISVLTLGLGYWLLAKMGLPGIGIASTLAQVIVALVVAVPLWRAVQEVPRGGQLVALEVMGEAAAAEEA